MVYLSIPICILCLYGIKHINENYDAENPPLIHKIFIVVLFISALIIPGIIINDILSSIGKERGSVSSIVYAVFYIPYIIFVVKFTNKKTD